MQIDYLDNTRYGRVHFTSGHTSITNCAIATKHDYLITGGVMGKIMILQIVRNAASYNGITKKSYKML